jgi:hypothetical protein
MVYEVVEGGGGEGLTEKSVVRYSITNTNAESASEEKRAPRGLVVSVPLET